jgi:hypothetical protein
MEMTLLAVTLISLVIATAMSVLAWRLMRDERRRSEARIAALAAEIHEQDATVAVAGHDVTAVTELPFGDNPSTVAGAMFAATQPLPSRFRLFGAVAAGAVVVAAVVGTLVAVSDGPSSPVPAAREAAAPAKEIPLELVALGHEREVDRLTVRGVVRNPAAGAQMHQLTAVVLLFNHEGGFIASGRAAVEGSDMAPGAEKTFVVTVPAGADIGRYRVSFRSDDQVVPHVDRRS